MILDFGCGHGRKWNDHNDDAVGIDINPHRLLVAKSRIAVVQCDGRSLPFRSSVFSLILSDSVLEHIPNYRRAMLEILRVLATGGTVRLWQPVDNDPVFYMARRVAGRWRGDKVYSRFSSQQLVTILSSLFKVVSISYLPNAPFSGFFGFFNKKIPHPLEEIDQLYGSICKRTAIFHWQVVVEAIKDSEHTQESRSGLVDPTS